jgi:ubiquinone/menaquinone biosynthesis C-methylase UbiE
MNIDVGCGVNKKEGYIGIDIERGPVRDIVASNNFLPLKDGCIDKVYTRRSLQHTEDDNKALSEFYRVVKDGGEVEVITASYKGYFYYYLLGKNKIYKVFHFYTKNKLKHMLRNAGFYLIIKENIKNDIRLSGIK